MLAVFCRNMQNTAMLDLNNPQTRRDALRERLEQGTPLIATVLSAELGVSIDTIRRDLIALEQRGLVRRTRGGAMPVTAPMQPYLSRVDEPDPMIEPLAAGAVQLVPERATVFLDAGTTMNAVAAQLPETFRGLIVTPAPSVALAALSRGAKVHLIGGTLCPDGAMATGGQAERTAGDFAADICLLGACGCWPDFGLSAEDAGEAGVKRAMAQASAKVVVVTSASKLDWRGRHRVLSLHEIDTLVTDADETKQRPFIEADIEVLNV